MAAKAAKKVMVVPARSVAKKALFGTGTLGAVRDLEVVDVESLDFAVRMMNRVSEYLKDVEELVAPARVNAHAAWKATKEIEKTLRAPGDEALKIIKGKIGAFNAKERARIAAEAEARRIAEEQERALFKYDGDYDQAQIDDRHWETEQEVRRQNADRLAAAAEANIAPPPEIKAPAPSTPLVRKWEPSVPASPPPAPAATARGVSSRVIHKGKVISRDSFLRACLTGDVPAEAQILVFSEAKLNKWIAAKVRTAEGPIDWAKLGLEVTEHDEVRRTGR